MTFEGIGASVAARKTVRFLSGRGKYTDDINRPASFTRTSSAPTGRTRESTSHRHVGGEGGTWRGRGVHRAPTWRPTGAGGLPCGWQIHNKDGSPMAEPQHPVLAAARCATSATRSLR